MKKAKDMSKLHEDKESTMEEGRETKMEKEGYEETESGKMVKPKKAFMGLAVEAAKNPVSLLGLAAKNKMGLIGGANKLKDKYFAKGGMTKSQKKVGKVMSEFKAGKLKSSSGKKVTNPKQAIAIGLSEAGMSKKKMMGGMMSDGVSEKGMGIEKKMGGGMMSDGVANRGSGIEMKSKGGMVRGQGIAIRGTKFKGIF
jgi:hypothetical protein